MVFHGTNAEFDQFDLSKKGSNTEWINTVHGFFFCEKVEHAKLFGQRIIQAEITMKKAIDLRLTSIFTKEEQASVVVEAFSGEKLDNEAAMEWLNEEIGLGEIGDLYDMLDSEESHDLFVKAGYDSIISNLGDNNNEYVVFNPEQIRQINRNYKQSELLIMDFSKSKQKSIGF